MILGLDISTSITGYTILGLDGKIIEIGHWNTKDKNDYPNLFSKTVFIKKKLGLLGECHSIDYVFVEPALNMFMIGKSSSHTISTLIKFNGIVSWLCYEEFKKIPKYIPASSARKKCGITIKRGTKAKIQVIDFLLDTEPDFKIEYTRTGKPKPHCYDEADSLIIAKAGFKCLKEKLE